MINRLAVATLALALLSSTLPAEAQDAFRPGKWEYTITTRMPNVPQLPPGVQLPPNVQMQAGGMTATHTSCINSNDPTAELSKPRGPRAAESRCTVERMTRAGGTISWATTCTSPDATVRTEGNARYQGDRMEADTKTRTTQPNGAPIEVSNHIAGRYLGPCDAR